MMKNLLKIIIATTLVLTLTACAAEGVSQNNRVIVSPEVTVSPTPTPSPSPSPSPTPLPTPQIYVEDIYGRWENAVYPFAFCFGPDNFFVFVDKIEGWKDFTVASFFINSNGGVTIDISNGNIISLSYDSEKEELTVISGDTPLSLTRVELTDLSDASVDDFLGVWVGKIIDDAWEFHINTNGEAIIYNHILKQPYSNLDASYSSDSSSGVLNLLFRFTSDEMGTVYYNANYYKAIDLLVFEKNDGESAVFERLATGNMQATAEDVVGLWGGLIDGEEYSLEFNIDAGRQVVICSMGGVRFSGTYEIDGNTGVITIFVEGVDQDLFYKYDKSTDTLEANIPVLGGWTNLPRVT